MSTGRRHRPKVSALAGSPSRSIRGAVQDERYYISTERVAAPESGRVEGQGFHRLPGTIAARRHSPDWTGPSHLWQFNAAGNVVKYDHVTDTAQMIRMAKGG